METLFQITSARQALLIQEIITKEYERIAHTPFISLAPFRLLFPVIPNAKARKNPVHFP